jgi:hypothetical protein
MTAADETNIQIDAIYCVCEWHMVDPDRFRRHLKWENDIGWVSPLPCFHLVDLD